jgi:hypothetical protein
MPASMSASVEALRSAARREPSWLSMWSERVMMLCGKRAVKIVRAKVLERVTDISETRLLVRYC